MIEGALQIEDLRCEDIMTAFSNVTALPIDSVLDK
jgi:Mg2+/Co2+ transporter CorC